MVINRSEISFDAASPETEKASGPPAQIEFQNAAASPMTGSPRFIASLDVRNPGGTDEFRAEITEIDAGTSERTPVPLELKDRHGEEWRRIEGGDDGAIGTISIGEMAIAPPGPRTDPRRFFFMCIRTLSGLGTNEIRPQTGTDQIHVTIRV